MKKNKKIETKRVSPNTPDTPKKSNTYLIVGGIAILLVIIFGYFYITEEPLVEVDRATTTCIANNSIFYGADWCGHCRNQKEMFGNNVELLNYIECEDNKDICTNERIRIYPTWEIEGKRYTGVQSVEKLKELTGC